MKKLSQLIWPLAIAVGVASLMTWAYFEKPMVLETLELKAFDARLLMRGDQETSGQVIVVAVDEQSLEKVGRWPWDRRVTAGLVKALDAMGPKAVAYDIIFSEKQENPAGDELVRLIQNAGPLGLTPTPELRSYLKERLAETSSDLALARSLASATEPQVLGYYFNFDPGSAAGQAGHTLDLASSYFEKRLAGAQDAPIPVPVAQKARTNIEMLAKAARSQAFFNVIPDEDGTIRRYNMAIEYDGGYYMPLAAAMFGHALPSAPPFLLASVNGLVGAEWERHVVPTDSEGRVIVNYRGPAGTIPHVPAWKILAGEVAPEEFRNKYLMVGVTAPTVYDMRVTPMSVNYPGIEIHATALDQMLLKDFIRRPGWAPLYDIAAIWIFAALTVAYLWRARTFFTLVGFLGLAALFVYGNYHFFTAKQFWLNLVYPMLSFSATYVLLNTYRYIFADRQKKQIRSAFAKYLDPSVVAQVTEDPGKLALGGEKLELTVLFSDIRGFTGLSEGMEPGELVRFLNAYLDEMTRLVMHHKGLLDKYVGDAIMAVYGAPYPYEDHAVRACETALDMVERLRELNPKWVEKGWSEVKIGIGVNTGEMIAGNMGSSERFDYTVIGDDVNLASRLEGLNKIYHVDVIISQNTQARVGEHFWTRTIDFVRVKGRDEPVEIFELVGPISKPQPYDHMAEYLEMIAEYRKPDFAEAGRRADKLAGDHPEDPLCVLYAARIKQMLENPPDPESWDGVCTYQEK